MSKIILSKNFIIGVCKLALNEDLYPSGDITSNLLKKNINKKIKLIANENGIIGGLEFAKQTFKLIDKKIKFNIKKREGSVIKKGNVVATIKGSIKSILTAERVALNFLSHISGIATKTNKFVKKAGKKSIGSTMYVTLEPCYHNSTFGSCAKQIIQSKINNIFIIFY